MEKQEQLIRIAKIFGNGAHIAVPKEWIGQQIIVIRPLKNSVKRQILETLEPYLDYVVGVYLYGSHARNESDEYSDIDLLIITNKKIEIKKSGFEIVCIEEEKLSSAINFEPLLLFSILSEAIPIINPRLLEELRLKYAPKLGKFSEFFKDTKRIIKINEDFLDKEKDFYVSGESNLYSIVLRLRGLFIINCLLSNKRYSHKSFELWVEKKLSGVNFRKVYGAYRASKNELKVKEKIRVKDLRLLLNLLNKELTLIKNG
jgi:predicted nucleotidyltransferase